jgi:hypothetical protein
MVHYDRAKVVSLGAPGHVPGVDTLWVTTVVPSVFLADLRRKYRLHQRQVGLAGRTMHPLFGLIDRVGVDRLTVRLLFERACGSKADVNRLLEEVKLVWGRPLEEVVQASRERKDITNARHVANVRGLLNKMGADHWWVMYYEPERVMAFIEGIERGRETKKNYWKAVLALMTPSHHGELIQRYGECLRRLQEEIDAVKNKQLKEAGMPAYKTPEEFAALSREYETAEAWEDHVISLFYGGEYFPVWRLKELMTLKVRHPNVIADNYVDWSAKTVVLNDYKTSHLYGRETIPVPDAFLAALQRHVDKSGVDTDYLLTGRDGQPYNESSLSRKITRVMGACVDDLRSMYITWAYHTGRLRTKEQQIEFCRGMRNSPDVLHYYIKFD